MPTYQIYTSRDGKPDELVGPYEGLEQGAVAFCYDNWPEYIEHQNAIARGEWGHRLTGRPPFEILRGDGSWHPWYIETDDDDHDDDDEKTEPVVLDESVSCQKCESHRVASAYGKCSDLGGFSMGSIDHEGYTPDGVGIGGGDDIDFRYCLDCGQMQGKWPLPLSPIEMGET